MSMMRLGKLEKLTGADMITLSRVPAIFPSSYESMEIRKVSAPGGAICGCRIMLPFPRVHNDTAYSYEFAMIYLQIKDQAALYNNLVFTD